MNLKLYQKYLGGQAHKNEMISFLNSTTTVVNLKNNFNETICNKRRTRTAIFPSRRWENDRLVLQQLNLWKEHIFESKKLSMETLMDELEPI